MSSFEFDCVYDNTGREVPTVHAPAVYWDDVNQRAESEDDAWTILGAYEPCEDPDALVGWVLIVR